MPSFGYFEGHSKFQACVSASAQFVLQSARGDAQHWPFAKVLIGQLVGAAVALPSSRLSDRFGCKPMVFASCYVLCAAHLHGPTALGQFSRMFEA